MYLTIVWTLLFSGVCASFTLAAANCDYYASPSGAGNGGTQSTAFKVADFWKVATPGKTLCLVNGTYKEPDSMIDPPDNLKGTAGNPLTVRALNDGKVTIDGQDVRRPVYLGPGNDYYVLEGFNAHSSNGPVVRLWNASHNIVRRVAAWDAADGNWAVFSAGESTNNLFEDVAGWGIARKTFSGAQGGNKLTCRRCWGRWEGSHEVGPKMTYTLAYNNYDMFIENSIGTWSGEKMKQTYQLQCPPSSTYTRCGTTFTNYNVDQPVAIFGIDGLTKDEGNNANSSIIGSIGYISIGDNFQPSALYTVSSVESIEYANNVAYIEGEKHSSKGTFDLFTIEGGAQNLHANDVTSIGGDGASIHAVWQTSNVDEGATLGDVASVFASSTGARICKRYVDGVLTDAPLWPWPMNQRILDAMIESGRAPVDVTATIEQFLGKLPDECRSDAREAAPNPPANLRSALGGT